MVRNQLLAALLALEAIYLVGIMAVAVPFGMAMDTFEDGKRSGLTYGGIYAVLIVSVAVLALAVVAIWRRWAQRPDCAAAARAAVGTAAMLNFSAAVAAVAAAFTGEALFWVPAAGYGVATGLGCLKHRAQAVAT